MRKPLFVVGTTLVCVLAFSRCQLPIPGLTSSEEEPPVDTSTGGNGVINVGGQPTDYTVLASESQLLLASLKMDAQACSLFHHHAVSALSVAYEFTLDRDNPGGSTLTARVGAAGLDPDKDEYRAHFPETSGSSVPERDRRDIRINMLDQLGASEHPVLTFTARNLSTLDGSGTAEVTAEVKGRQSVFTMQATARWEGDKLIMEGTGTLDGTQHDIPVGSFKDCINPSMPLTMKLTLVPGRNDTTGLPDASVPPFVPTHFPDESACGPVGFDDVRDALLLDCAGCHNDPPINGAKTRLMGWDDFHKDSALAQGVPLFETAAGRMQDTSPSHIMPPDPYVLAQDEWDNILAWLETGAHQHKCDANGNPLPLGPDPAALTCPPGSLTWPDDEEEWDGHSESEMNPGMDCIDCHTEENVRVEGRRMTLGGTVMAGLNQRERCFGVSGLRVTITDQNGSFTLSTNASGNFFTTRTVTPPYRAVVEDPISGNIREMVTEQTETSCNKCHTERGTSALGSARPHGRIVAP
ncbi:MAG: hypothetical protein AB2A00_14630 [Myxococcota bacterium]